MSESKENVWRVEFRPYQSAFYKSEVRYPALGSAWGTGKSLAMILKGHKFSTDYSHNLGVIFRKEYTNLRNSTMKDYVEYTGMTINEGKKSAIYPNGSEILFMHLDEIGVVQNMNLGWFGIEQADEMPSPDPFNMLRGRLRRAVPKRQGMAIMNATSEEHWAFQLWKNNPESDPSFRMWEATSFDNAVNLPADTIEDWRKLEKTDPVMFRRFIMNEWGISDDQFAVIRSEWLGALLGRGLPELPGSDILQPPRERRRIVSIDPSLGGDECTIKYFENCEVKDKLSLFERDTMKIVGNAAAFAGGRTTNFIVDDIGIGDGVAARLTEMKFNVQRFTSTEKALNEKKFSNHRAEGWWYLREQVQNQMIPYPADPEIRRQIVAFRYRPEKLGSNGKIAIELKTDVKKRIGRSPDDGDNYMMGIYGTQFVKPEAKPSLADRWGIRKHKNRGYSHMSA